MTDSTNWNKDAMINDLNEQILRLQEKIKELDGKVAEYEKRIDKHEEVLDLFTSTDEERVYSLLVKLVDEIRLDVEDYFKKFINRNYKMLVDNLKRKLKESVYTLSKRIDKEVKQRVDTIVEAIAEEYRIFDVVNVDADFKDSEFKVATMDAETVRRIIEGENDDNRQKRQKRSY